VCEPEVRSAAREMKLETADSLEEAFRMAEEIKGTEAHIVVIPDGVSVIVE